MVSFDNLIITYVTCPLLNTVLLSCIDNYLALTSRNIVTNNMSGFARRIQYHMPSFSAIHPKLID